MKKINHGRLFEKQVADSASWYERKGWLTLRKTEPPTRQVMLGGKWIPIPLKNDLVDFVGVWTEQNGRALFIEAKSTGGNRLPIITGGLDSDQIESLRRWRRAGAVVGVLWECRAEAGGGTYWVSMETLEKVISGGRKSLWPDDGVLCPPGEAWCTCDFRVPMQAGLVEK